MAERIEPSQDRELTVGRSSYARSMYVKSMRTSINNMAFFEKVSGRALGTEFRRVFLVSKREIEGPKAKATEVDPFPIIYGCSYFVPEL